jgi:Tol biopolymer transport system component
VTGRSRNVRRFSTKSEWYWYHVTWSPDGRRIAVVSPGPANRSAIFLFDAGGSNRKRTRLATGPTSVGWPSWSPDSTQIAYAELASPASSSGNEYGGVYVSREDGSGRVRIAAHGLAPAWSPDGKRIAYLAACGIPPFKESRLTGIRLVTPSGRQLSGSAGSTACSTLGVAGPPVWAPDGTKIAMATTAGVFTMNPDGTHLTKLTNKAPTSIAANRLSWIRPSWQAR